VPWLKPYAVNTSKRFENVLNAPGPAFLNLTDSEKKKSGRLGLNELPLPITTHCVFPAFSDSGLGQLIHKDEAMQLGRNDPCSF
jgi:hypothetical protein